jgi:hypothetical protein
MYRLFGEALEEVTPGIALYLSATEGREAHLAALIERLSAYLETGAGAGLGISPPGAGLGISPPGTGLGASRPGAGLGASRPGTGLGASRPGARRGAGGAGQQGGPA